MRERWPQIGRIAVTGDSGELYRGELPAHAVILKPCDLGALRELLRMLPVLTHRGELADPAPLHASGR